MYSFPRLPNTLFAIYYLIILYVTHNSLWKREGYRSLKSRIYVPVQNLGDTAMADPQLSADDTGPHPRCSHLDDLQPDVVGQWTPIDKHPAQLIDPALTLEGVAREQRGQGHVLQGQRGRKRGGGGGGLLNNPGGCGCYGGEGS